MNNIDFYCKKINKLQKTNKYVNKLGNKIYELTGGFKKYSNDVSKRNTNLEELFEYIKTNVNNKKEKTKEKYLVILMGPPASGKTLARKFASKYIYKHLENTNGNDNDIDKIFNSFIDISVDEFVNDGAVINSTNLEEKTGKELFADYAQKYKSLLASSVDKNSELFTTLNDETQKLYFNLRPNFDAIGNIIFNLASYLEMNIFYETIGNSSDIEDLAKNFCAYFGYNLLVIYPHVSDKAEHLRRLDERRKEDGRLVKSEYFEKLLVSSDIVFDKLRTSIPLLLSPKFKKAVFIKFKNDTKKPDNYDFTNFEIEKYHSFNYDNKKPDMS